MIDCLWYKSYMSQNRGCKIAGIFINYFCAQALFLLQASFGYVPMSIHYLEKSKFEITAIDKINSWQSPMMQVWIV